MNNYIKILQVIVSCTILSCNGAGLWNLKEVPPCTFTAGFDITLDSTCTVPCTVQFTPHALNDPGLRYKWVFSDQVVIESTVAEREFTSPGNYTVTLTINGYGCEGDSSAVFVIGVPAPAVDFTPGDTTVIAPASLTFTEKTVGATSFEWFIDGVPAGDGSSQLHDVPFLHEDTVQITLRASGPGGDSERSHLVIVRPLTFSLKKFLVGTAGESEAAYGVDEMPDQGFFLVVNNKKANFLCSTNTTGSNPAPSSPFNLAGAYSQLQANSFEKTGTGYLLIGTALKTTGNTDYFVFKARQNFTFFGEKAISQPLSSANEAATGIVSLSGNTGYLVNGEGEWSGKGLYLSELDISLNATHKPLFTTDATVRSQAIDALPNGNYILTARSPAMNQTFVQFLDSARNPSGSMIPIGTAAFIVLDIVVWDAQTVFVFGTESNQAKVVKLVNGVPIPPWTFNHLFRAGLRSSDGRLIFAGKDQVTGLPAWFEVDPDTGNLQVQGFASPLITEGQFNALAETRDGGFILAGQGALSAESYQTILVKTDRNGKI